MKKFYFINQTNLRRVNWKKRAHAERKRMRFNVGQREQKGEKTLCVYFDFDVLSSAPLSKLARPRYELNSYILYFHGNENEIYAFLGNFYTVYFYSSDLY